MPGCANVTTGPHHNLGVQVRVAAPKTAAFILCFSVWCSLRTLMRQSVQFVGLLIRTLCYPHTYKRLPSISFWIRTLLYLQKTHLLEAARAHVCECFVIAIGS